MERKIYLTSDFELVEDIPHEAEASTISLNPFCTWAKFTFTDDLPNANKQRIPIEEFPNIVKTGIYMPIKMAVGQINDGHDKATPLGTIAQLKVDGNKVLGLAALWMKERPEDIELLKTKINESEVKPQLSWEVLYEDSSVDELEVQTLKGVAVRATTIVGLPAYQGRTSIYAMASENKTEENKVTLEELQAKYDLIEKQYNDTISERDSLKTQLSEKETALASQTDELTQLKEFKNKIEQEKQADEKMASIKKLFADSGITKDETYFTERKEKFLAMEQEGIEFIVQELVAGFSSANASDTSTEIPNLQSTSKLPTSGRELGKLLREIK